MKHNNQNSYKFTFIKVIFVEGNLNYNNLLILCLKINLLLLIFNKNYSSLILVLFFFNNHKNHFGAHKFNYNN